MSLRPLAAAIGSSPRVLLYLFDSKDGLIRALLGRARDNERELLAGIAEPGSAPPVDLLVAARVLWTWLAHPDHRGCSCCGSRRTRAHWSSPTPSGFARSTVEDWLSILATSQPASEHDPPTRWRRGPRCWHCSAGRCSTCSPPAARRPDRRRRSTNSCRRVKGVTARCDEGGEASNDGSARQPRVLVADQASAAPVRCADRGLALRPRARGCGMAEIEVDYLVVGAGASGMAFVDALVAEDRDAEVVLVDRRHRPGGHWLDAYPFVRLHQPSATYGVNSRTLGDERIDEIGPERRLLRAGHRGGDRRLLRQGPGGGPPAVRACPVPRHGRAPRRGRRPAHAACSLLTGEETTVRVRRRFVDATYTESSIPSTAHARVHDRRGRGRRPAERPRPPRRSRRRATRSSAPARRRWTRAGGCSRSASNPAASAGFAHATAGTSTAAFTQPLEQVGSFMQLQARLVAPRPLRRGCPGLRPPARGRRGVPPDRPRRSSPRRSAAPR